MLTRTDAQSPGPEILIPLVLGEGRIPASVLLKAGACNVQSGMQAPETPEPAPHTEVELGNVQILCSVRC